MAPWRIEEYRTVTGERPIRNFIEGLKGQDEVDGTSRQRDVARWRRDALGRVGVTPVPKTSGASGLHLYVPLAPGTTWALSGAFCETVARFVTRAHPAVATVERAMDARGARVYVDCLQNLRGKTLACAYSVRANRFAGVSAPLTWNDVDSGVEPADFTLRTIEARVRGIGDLWAAVRAARPVDLTGMAAA